jgi:hypothetical protein
LGYHFGYLGYMRQAVTELDKALDLQPKDLGSQKLRDLFAQQAGIAPRTVAQPPQAQPPQGAPAPGNPPESQAPPPS